MSIEEPHRPTPEELEDLFRPEEEPEVEVVLPPRSSRDWVVKSLNRRGDPK